MQEKTLMIFSTMFIIGMSWHVSMNLNIIVLVPILLLLLYIQNPFPMNPKYIYILLAFALIFVFWSILNITIYDKVNLEATDKFVKKSIFGFLLMVFIFVFYGKRKDLLAKSIDYALIIIVSLWFMQLIVFYISGEYIDLLEPLLGSERAQRYKAYFIQSALPIDFIRPTSIYIEPGTYAVNTFPLLVLSYMTHHRITFLHKALLFSYFASLSLFAIVISTLFIFTAEISKFEFRFSKKNILLILLSVVIVSAIMFYVEQRFSGDHGGTDQLNYRAIVINHWLSLNSVDTLLGLGNGQTVFDGKEPPLVEDASFLFKLMFEFGIFLHIWGQWVLISFVKMGVNRQKLGVSGF